MDASSDRQAVISPQFPGSGPRCFRVQVMSREQSQWLLYASFRSRGAADECLNGLQQRGLSARLVRCNALPTAA